MNTVTITKIGEESLALVVKRDDKIFAVIDGNSYVSRRTAALVAVNLADHTGAAIQLDAGDSNLSLRDHVNKASQQLDLPCDQCA